MGKKANPAVIGGFVVGAVVLVVAGVLVFGGGDFWSQTEPWVSYFPGSVKGLQIGAPVTFRGVKIGEVTDIMATLDARERPVAVRTPVYWEFDPSRVTTIGISEAELLERKRGRSPFVDPLIKRGLRAELQLKSFVTGQQVIQLDFHPDTPIKLVGAEDKVPEFPTVESGLAELTKSIEELPLRDLADGAVALIQHIDQLVSSPELKATITSLNETVKEYKKLGRDIDEQILPPTSDALTDASKLMRNIDSQVTPAARDTLREATATLSTAKDAIGERSELRYQLTNMLAELSSAARSIRVLAAYLEQHPEALLQGKGGPGGNRR